ncbi:MAG: hypothetical protein EOO39_04420 [Cytophagaceae bacterium]|nr:MAG: hypothetical protein EOO39_04420 [Cytophagaceae bacterium]
MDRLDYEARERGHEGIHSGTYATLYVITSLIARILDKLTPEFSLLALFIPAYVFLIPSVKQFNFYWEQETSYAVPRTMSSGAIVTLIFGILLFLVVVIGLLQPS